MYIYEYEIACTITSFIIMVSSGYILIVTDNFVVIFITFSGFTSFLTRLLRIKRQEYIMDHPLVYLDIISAIFAFESYLFLPFDFTSIKIAFLLMVVAAILSWNIFHVNLVKESFILQLLGHIIIASELSLLCTGNHLLT